MRFLAGLVVVLTLGFSLPVWADEPDVGQLVESAVTVLKTTSYEARLRFLARHEEGEEPQTVHIYHVAPDLYRVEPLEQDEHGQWLRTDYYYIENADELLLITRRANAEDIVNEMPERSFYVNDALTGKFLRDLARHSGTTVRGGMVGNTYEVDMLLQLATPEKPYTITVGLDRGNHFPLFLLVNDSQGEARVYLEVEAIEYREPLELDGELFTPPAVSNKMQQRGPRVEELAPESILDLNEPVGAEQPSIQILRSTSSVDYNLPLYPANVPEGYQLEGLHLLDFPIDGERSDVALVYQFELFNPAVGDTVSVFLTQAEDFAFGPSAPHSTSGGGYVVQQVDGWLVAVFGALTAQELREIALGLTDDTGEVEALLDLTRARDMILQEALNISGE